MTNVRSRTECISYENEDGTFDLKLTITSIMDRETTETIANALKKVLVQLCTGIEWEH